MEATKSARSKFVCQNCGIGIKKDGIEAMKDAGFALHHLACPECGEHTIVYRDPERELEEQLAKFR